MREHDLSRFVLAQNAVYDRVKEELAAGRKRSHWMWYIFPQLRGLGRSETSYFYGVADRDEAGAYLRHPVLGARLTECCALLLAHEGRAAEDILGELDAQKLRSSMTLFALASDEGSIFQTVLEVFFGGRPDRRTVSQVK